MSSTQNLLDVPLILPLESALPTAGSTTAYEMSSDTGGVQPEATAMKNVLPLPKPLPCGSANLK